MTDKERILMAIIANIIPGMMYSLPQERDKYATSCMYYLEKLKNGDLVFANTNRTPHDFLVGFVECVKYDCVVIREIGSKRLCNYYNEAFTIINKEKLGYEVLEGVQYKTFQKVRKAFNKYTGYGTRFKFISFDDGLCIVQAREAFKSDTYFVVSFPYNSKTTIKSIGELLQQKERELGSIK